jgi:predicted hotdog family 3-hydroxylacyl-ACP dehydratase
MSAPPKPLDRAGIAARVPHAGRMCLLDSLLDWSDAHIRCTVTSHADPAHPLRTRSGLWSTAGVEFAGQAMALHAALCAAAAGGAPRAGFLASVRGMTLHVPRLDTAAGPLQVQATRLLGDESQAQYAFRLLDAVGALLVDGRATVVLDGIPKPA